MLSLLGDNLKLLSSQFEVISFTHFFWELNTVAISLSMERQRVEEGQMIVENVARKVFH